MAPDQKSNLQEPAPPRQVDWLLERFCAPHKREEVLGDLHERYYYLVAQVGQKQADRRYYREVLSYLRLSVFRRKKNHYPYTFSPSTFYLAMFQNYLLIALRNTWKNKVYTAINVTGMAVAITSVLFIFLYVRQELTYDQFHQKVNRIRVLGLQPREGTPYYQTMLPALPQLLEEYPAVESGTRFLQMQMNWVGYRKKEFYESVNFVDTSFFSVFTFPLLRGDPNTALHDPSAVVLSKEIADKLFGKEDPIGKTITFDNGASRIVSGVMAPVPANSTLQPKLLLPMSSLFDFVPWMKEAGNWYNNFISTYVLLAPGIQDQKLEGQLPAFARKHFDKNIKDYNLRLLPFAQLHKQTADTSAYVYGLSCVAVFLLLVACINFTNLTTATSFSRLKEIAVRKVLGSQRGQLLSQFLAEAFVLSLGSLLIAVLLTLVLLPSFNQIMELQLSLSSTNDYHIWIFLTVLMVAVGILAGGYPAWYLSSFKAATALKGKLGGQPGGGLIRNGLVVVQFAIAVFLIVGTLMVSRQINFMKHADLKFDRENVLVVDLNSGYKDEKRAKAQINFILDRLSSQTGVRSFSTSQNIPGSYWAVYNSFTPDGSTKEAVSLRKASVDEGYVPTYGIKLAEGRNFSTRLASDSTHAVMINKAAMKALGWQTAVGKTLREFPGGDTEMQVIGVMEDFHYQSLQGKVEPLIHSFSGRSRIENNQFLSIKVTPERTSSVINFLKEHWRQIPARKEFSYFFVDEAFNKQYVSVERTLALITFFTTITILIAAAGLFALTSLSTRNRTKEIGIRKVMGATVGSIVGMLFRDFLRLIVLANLIAWPLAYFAGQKWLSSFAYQIAFGWWVFALAGLMAVAIALLTMSIQAIKAALADPVRSLRSE